MEAMVGLPMCAQTKQILAQCLLAAPHHRVLNSACESDLCAIFQGDVFEVFGNLHMKLLECKGTRSDDLNPGLGTA